MYEAFGFETLTAPEAVVIFGALLGLAFGVLAERTQFCFRRAVIAGPDRKQAAGVWAMALFVALTCTQGAVALGWISFADHRFLSPDLPLLAIVLGGALFGAGMVLTRGCISRLTVLGAGGNLRALTVLLVFAVVAHASIKGVLAPLRMSLGAATLPLGGALPLAFGAALALGALVLALTSGNRPVRLALAAALGLLVPLGWVGTGFVLYDDFDPVALESLSFTAPAADALFFTIASTAVAPTFGAGIVGGTLLGALLASLAFGGFAWQSFTSPRETGRYLLGGALMGFGGALAGGCTLGAGLSGVPSLSVAAFIALLAIGLGGWTMDRALTTRIAPAPLPAE